MPARPRQDEHADKEPPETSQSVMRPSAVRGGQRFGEAECREASQRCQGSCPAGDRAFGGRRALLSEQPFTERFARYVEVLSDVAQDAGQRTDAESGVAGDRDVMLTSF